MSGKYIELVELSVYNRGKIIGVKEFRNQRRDYEAYTSMFMFGPEVVDYVANNISPKTGKPSIDGYIGECSATYLWIDIDFEGELDKAIAKLIEIVGKLESKYGVNYQALTIYFSGNKGFHIGIHNSIFGGQEYSSPVLPQVFKQMVRAITDNSDGVDYRIYNTSRLFRLPFSKHPKTGLYKVPVDYTLLVAGKKEEVLDYSNFCKKHVSYSPQIEYSERLAKLFNDCVENCINNVDLHTDADGYQTPVSLQNNTSIFRLPEIGSRNDSVYKMMYRLFNIQGLKVNEIVDLSNFIYEVVNIYASKKGQPRYSEMEFKISLNSAYSRTRLKPVKRMSATDFTDMAIKMFQKIKNSQFVSTPIPEIDQDLKGGWMLGNLYSFIGKGGTMKSYLLQESIIKAALS